MIFLEKAKVFLILDNGQKAFICTFGELRNASLDMGGLKFLVGDLREESIRPREAGGWYIPITLLEGKSDVYDLPVWIE